MKQQQEMMELYKREKVSPLSGCLPVVIQIPVFFALYKVISDLDRNAPCAVLRLDPGSLGARSDQPVQSVRPASLGRRRTLLMIGVWPLIMGVTMWLQMRLNPTPPDPVQAQPVQLDAGDLHLHAGTFPVGPRDLLGVEQHPVDPAAVAHHEAPGRRGRLLRQYPRQPALPQTQESRRVERAHSPTDQIERAACCSPARLRFIMGVAKLEQLPPPQGVEIAFAGRSNVGKSSLINALTGVNDLARASNTPGRTRELNFFDVGEGAHARRHAGLWLCQGAEERCQEVAAAAARLSARPARPHPGLRADRLRATASLKADEEMFELLDEAAVTYQLVLTKTDKIKPARAGAGRERTPKPCAKKRPAAFPLIHVTSSETGTRHRRAARRDRRALLVVASQRDVHRPL